MERQPNEPILPDNYPVHAGYLYVVDGEPINSDISGTVADLKRITGGKEIRGCDIAARNLWDRTI